MADPGRVETYRTSDGAELYLRRWQPAGRPWARLTFLHGARSHGEWYAGGCSEFAAAGIAVSLLERRGAGLNSTRRGDAPNFRRLIDDVAEFLLRERRRRADLPQVVLGVSWGGKLAAALPYRAPGLAAGLVLACPGLCPSVSPPVGTRLRIALARLIRPTRPFPMPLNEVELFTDSAQWRAFLAGNRYDLHAATARFLTASAAFDIYLRRARFRVDVPVLTLLAGRDAVVDNPRTRAFVAGFPSRDNRVRDYPEAAHTLEFEPGRPYIGDTVAWMRARFG